MKISITHRLFFSILAATALGLLCMLLIMQWSINLGFLQYLNSMDQNRLEVLADRLERVYAENGNWDFLRENPELFHALAEESGNAANRMEPPPVAPPGPHRPRTPFVVTDADRNPIIGNPIDTKDSTYRPVLSGGKTVGYIALMSPKHFLSPPQIEFLKHQKLALVFSAMGMVLIVAFFSVPLAKRLVRPIKSIAEATHDLASGNYAVRVKVSSSDELGRLADDFNAMALTLERNEKARRQWVADISHELRTPLAILRGEVEALLEGIRSTTPESIRSIHSEVLRLHRLVEDLYQLSLYDLGALTYRKEYIDLSKVLRGSEESFRIEFAHKDIGLAEDLPDGTSVMIHADKERLDQLFSNLFENSLRYTDPGGQLVVRLTCKDRQTVIDFADSAPGVPEEELDRLFDRLYRVESSRSRSTGGAGLGLAICKNIVEAHDGTISAHSSPLGGVTIRVVLPMAVGCS